MEDIIESLTISFTSNDCTVNDSYAIVCKKPKNFKEMVLCENQLNKKPVKYEILDNDIKFIVDSLDPINIYFTVTSNEIYNFLTNIMKVE